jgi:hypothetical protein
MVAENRFKKKKARKFFGFKWNKYDGNIEVFPSRVFQFKHKKWQENIILKKVWRMKRTKNYFTFSILKTELWENIILIENLLKIYVNLLWN